MESQVTRSIFGADIDRRCPGYGWVEKFLVIFGILGDVETNARIAQLHDEQDCREERF